jgi:crossover junction endodeoxyribonuclease RusA
MEITFSVGGNPIPKGSMKHIGNGRMIDQTKVKPWMSLIRKAAIEIAKGEIISLPCMVEVEFRFARPMSARNRLYPHLRSVGDIDKLSRAVLDALQGSKTEQGVLTDDSLVVDLIARKRYLDYGMPGATISVKELI